MDKTWRVYGGAAVDLGPISLAGGAGVGRTDRPGTPFRPPEEKPADFDNFRRMFYNVGAQYRFDPFAFSVNWGQA